MEKVSCDVCGKKFKTEDALVQHKNDAHKQQTQSPVERHTKSKLSTGTIVTIIIVALFLGGAIYGAYWSLTTPTMGPIGSAHAHADFAIYINDKAITPLPQQFYLANNYIHANQGPGAGSVLHTGATNVPLKIFFDSIEMKLTSSCFDVGGVNYCNDGVNTLKMYVKHVNGNWENNTQFEKYVLQDLDKILISYGHDSSDVIISQQNNVTDFAKDNTGKSDVIVGSK